MALHPLKVAWISYFPIEWWPGVPEPLQRLPRQHAASWQRVLLNELKTVPNLKLHVFSVRHQFEQDQSFELDGVTFHCLRVPPGMRTLSLFWWETLKIRQVLRQVAPDLIHAWGSERAAALVAARLPYPHLVTMQGLLQWYMQQVDLGRVTRLESWLEHFSLKRASVVTCESTFAVHWLREHYPRLEVRQAEHAPDWLFHRLQRRPQIRPVRFLFVGAIGFLKGSDLLLLALDRLVNEVDFRLTLVGAASGEFWRQLKAQTSAELWKRIEVRQNLTPAEVAHELEKATMVLFPTRADTSPNSVKEAVVAGVPVLASAVGGIVDYVIPGQNGFVFPPSDLEALIRAIRLAVVHPLFKEGRVDSDTLSQKRNYLSPLLMQKHFLAAYQAVLDKRQQQAEGFAPQ